MPDKFTATWLSHSSVSDFLNCPRAYYLKNVYKDPKTNHKIQITSPALALGSSVHEVVESLSLLPTKDRFSESLLEKFDRVWKKYSGKRGGFLDKDTEAEYKLKGETMLSRVTKNPGPVANLSVKIKEGLPYYWLSEEDNIILCGKVDWLEYLPDSDSVHIIDFKTGKNKEKDDSLQLPIYHLLVKNTQKRKVDRASYWYLAQEDQLEPKELPDLLTAHEHILSIGKKIKVARQLNVFKCPEGESGCWHCRPMEQILKGEGEYVGENDFRQDMYILPTKNQTQEEDSVIL